jgi:hypothetical protein
MFSLLNKEELNKVYLFIYNSFSGRINGVKLGGVLENTLSNIIYKIIVFQEVNNFRIQEVSRGII